MRKVALNALYKRLKLQFYAPWIKIVYYICYIGIKT